ncbi:probable serine/threonine-protein kinase PBL2 [Gastrolobium bilobum]|uniref:probable serine/threonine-protein kinase PBL2 n=1 Tax=Gastrolobium bilobum TaxID=150636 RepID=UPI002AB27C1F|nr:probable serine/threonine-protein kinase PBL2 [Gastrolobium bilobum]
MMGNTCAKPVADHVSSSNFAGSKKPLSKTKQHSNSSEQKAVIQTSELNIVKSVSNNLKSFSLSDLKEATKNFGQDNLIGEGGFGRVFKGWIDENTYAPTKPGSGIVVAIKNLKQGSKGHMEWLAEVHYLGQLHHENLVKLIGYCYEDENRLLVYEFMQKGSLENRLFRKGVQPIAWITRVNIAIGVARGLTFLHSPDANVIFRFLKASNILLDSDFNVKLSGFDLARDGPTRDNTYISTRIIDQGYAAPEYLATGHLTPRSNVYSFGVVLLELLTGRCAMKDDRPEFSDEDLVDWAKPFLSDSRRVLRIMDTRLGGEYSRKGAQAAAALALQCLNTDPKFRPPMLNVLAALEGLHSSNTITRTPKSEIENHATKHSGHSQQCSTDSTP